MCAGVSGYLVTTARWLTRAEQHATAQVGGAGAAVVAAARRPAPGAAQLSAA